MEEQLHRASNGRLYQDPNNSVMQLHSCYTDLDCLADGHAALIQDCVKGTNNSMVLLKKGKSVQTDCSMLWLDCSSCAPALSKMDELLLEMKNDVSRLPSELSKLPTVSAQLKMDEISIISKLAKTSDNPSVITQAPPTNTGGPGGGGSGSSGGSEVVVLNKPTASKYTIVSSQAPGPQVQLPGQVAVPVQPPESLVMPVYSVASGSKQVQPVSVVQASLGQASSTALATTTSSTAPTITIGVPTYLDGSSVYQLLPTAVSGQQMVYWPPVVGGSGQTPAAAAQVTTVAATPVGTALPSQLTVVQQGSPQPQVLQPVQLSVDTIGGGGATAVTLATTGQGKAAKKTSVITID